MRLPELQTYTRGMYVQNLRRARKYLFFFSLFKGEFSINFLSNSSRASKILTRSWEMRVTKISSTTTSNFERTVFEAGLLAPQNFGKKKFIIYSCLSLSKGSWCNNVGVPSAGLCPSRLLLSRNWKQCRETKHSAWRCSLRCMHNVTWVTRHRAAAVQIIYRVWIKSRNVERYCIPSGKTAAKNYLSRD